MKHNNLKKAITALTSQRSDSTLPVVALLAGLAVGAVIGVLFAPERGEDIRNRISDKAKDLKDSAKDKFQTVKNKFHSEADELGELKDKVVNKAKSTAKEAVELKDEAVDHVKSKAKAVKEEVSDGAERISNA